MGSCQIWWKNLRKSMRISCELVTQKFVEKHGFDCFDCVGWWKRTDNCVLNGDFVNNSSSRGGKEKQIRWRIISEISTTST